MWVRMIRNEMTGGQVSHSCFWLEGVREARLGKPHDGQSNCVLLEPLSL